MTGEIPLQDLSDAPPMASVVSIVNHKCDQLFVYGILKRGFELDLRGKAQFVNTAMLPGAILYRVGSGVGLRLVEDETREVYGEVFKIPKGLWRWLDMIEANGFAYTRRLVEVLVGNPEGPDSGWTKAWVYEHTYPGMKYDRPIENGVFEHANI